MRLLDLLLISGALCGHVALWTALGNRMHGLVVRRPLVKASRLVIFVMNAGIPTVWGIRYLLDPNRFSDAFSSWSSSVAGIYCVFCNLVLLRTLLLWWIHQKPQGQTISPLISNHTEVLPLCQQQPLTRSTLAAILSRMPRNEIFDLAVNVKNLHMSRLPEAFNEMKITHLTDLHISKHMTPAFYQQIIDQTQQFRSDLILITGDLVDGVPELGLAVEQLSQLQAKLGVFYILGNHEIRLPLEKIAELDHQLAQSGLTRLCGRWHTFDYKGERLTLAGNALPWIGVAPPQEASPDDEQQKRSFRILLSHSPDQIHWARENSFDLMLAGHTHGGQVRFPVIGPVVCPSRFGGQYAAGLFDMPPTVMHVSRGISGMTPYRFRCTPELTQLVLRCSG